ncbi:hypothetical protein ACFPRL_27295 [Pseudoclavibacter helvolus]
MLYSRHGVGVCLQPEPLTKRPPHRSPGRGGLFVVKRPRWAHIAGNRAEYSQSRGWAGWPTVDGLHSIEVNHRQVSNVAAGGSQLVHLAG